MINIKILFCSLFTLCLIGESIAQAQILGPYGTSPITFGVDSNGLLSATGTYGTGTLSLSGAGTRMFWYPGKAAFRAGYVSGTAWNDANIGGYSAAFGQDNVASGAYSASFGEANTASGEFSFVLGYDSTASAIFSTAIGTQNLASGQSSFAAGGNNTASGGGAVALGSFSAATGGGSFAAGFSTLASGSTSSVALGYIADATGAASLATGQSTVASGTASASFNYFTKAQAYASTAFGRYNVGGYGTSGQTTWLSTDPLFEIGNGTSSSALSDAFVVYKNGSMSAQGTITANAGVLTTSASVAQTDIPMFTGN